jgi:hypothetical protein
LGAPSLVAAKISAVWNSIDSPVSVLRLAFAMGTLMYAVVASGDDPAATAPEFVDTLEEVAAVAKWEPLRRAVPIENQTEIRIWLGFGLAYPQDVVRLIVRPTRTSVEMLRWWPNDAEFRRFRSDTGETFEQLYAPPCAEKIASKVVVCRLALSPAAQLDAATMLLNGGLLSLSEAPPSPLGPWGMTIDGEHMVVEYLSGRYQTMYFDVSYPDAPQNTHQAQRVREIVSALTAHYTKRSAQRRLQLSDR